MLEIKEKILQGTTFIDLFAGLGGFRLALESLGAKCVYTNEWNKPVQKVYAENFGENETAGELFERLAAIGAELLKETIECLERGELKPVKQDEAAATKCGMIKKEDGRIDFNRPAQRIHDQVRGMNPWPVAFAMLDGQPVKIWATRMTERQGEGRPGECVIADPKEGLFVRTADKLIEIREIQFPGARRMEARAALLGHRLLGRVFE